MIKSQLKEYAQLGLVVVLSKEFILNSPPESLIKACVRDQLLAVIPKTLPTEGRPKYGPSPDTLFLEKHPTHSRYMQYQALLDVSIHDTEAQEIIDRVSKLIDEAL